MEKLGGNANALNWFEIPATDLSRAQKFYESIFDITMQFLDMGEMQMSMFPTGEKNVGGALAKSEYNVPSSTGALIYLNANPDLQTVLDKVESAGGQVAMPKTPIGNDWGFFAMIVDTEGNTVGLHSME
ncbi:MAG: VOC family protein [Candidatus Kapabacteria bacterium]|jgi:predicted enzyme related to lactoylglutathione lyase|nr:VOC family protein [Candidatus Kapabacteria bacterium]